MTPEQKLYESLNNNINVQTLTEGRIFPQFAPQDSDGEPFITYNTASKNTDSCLQGGTSAPLRISINISIFDSKYQNVKELADAVSIAVQTLNPVNLNEMDLYDYETKLHRTLVQVDFWD